MDEKRSGIEIFHNSLNEFKLSITDRQIDQFLEYYGMLVEWNEKMNLTAITDFHEVIRKHFVDSLSIVKVLNPTKETIIDLGTGAGFPGIPLKIAFPDTRIILLDSLKKRIQFLNAVIEKLQLKNIEALHGRAEDYGKEKKFREQFDISVSRAVAKMPILSEYCLPFVRKDGYFIAYKSGQIDEELSIATKAINEMGGHVESVVNFSLPGTDIERTLIAIRKKQHTPVRYPRSSGKPSKEPIQ